MSISTATFISLISTATFISLDDALSCPNNSYVDVIAIVADVGVPDHDTFFPIGIREVTIRSDTTLVLHMV